MSVTIRLNNTIHITIHGMQSDITIWALPEQDNMICYNDKKYSKVVLFLPKIEGKNACFYAVVENVKH